MRNKLLILLMLAFSVLAVQAQPEAPKNLTAIAQLTNFTKAVKLTWEAPTSYSIKFFIYKEIVLPDSTLKFVRIGESKGRGFVDFRVDIGKTYNYYVTTVNNMVESQPSNQASVTLNPIVNEKGIIKGVVLDEQSNLPIANARVRLVGTGSPYCLSAVTNTSGEFQIQAFTGSYIIETGAMNYAREFYNNVHDIRLATKIAVTNQDTTEVEIKLAPFAAPQLHTIKGSVKDEAGNPVRAIVNVLGLRANSHFRHMLGGRTDSLGNYQLNVRLGDTVVLHVQPLVRELLPEFYNDKNTYNDADRIYVDGNKENVNFVLQAKPVYNNSISGTVKDTNGLQVEAVVIAINRDLSLRHKNRYHVLTDSLTGAYSLSNLNPGNYILVVYPKSGYQPTYFQYNNEQTLNWREADTVVVENTSALENINFTVLPLTVDGFASIKGKVVDSKGTAVNGAVISILDENSNVVSFALTNEKGEYLADNLTPGNYKVSPDAVEYNGISKTITTDYNSNMQKSADFILTPESTLDVKNSEVVLKEYQLYQNYPNPFNPSTTIKFSIPERANVKIAVYNVLGVQVAEILNEVKDEGTYNITFNAHNLSSGVYFYKLETKNFNTAKKFTLIK